MILIVLLHGNRVFTCVLFQGVGRLFFLIIFFFLMIFGWLDFGVSLFRFVLLLGWLCVFMLILFWLIQFLYFGVNRNQSLFQVRFSCLNGDSGRGSGFLASTYKRRIKIRKVSRLNSKSGVNDGLSRGGSAVYGTDQQQVGAYSARIALCNLSCNKDVYLASGGRWPDYQPAGISTTGWRRVRSSLVGSQVLSWNTNGTPRQWWTVSGRVRGWYDRF
jgi:hypothetical protein